MSESTERVGEEHTAEILREIRAMSSREEKFVTNRAMVGYLVSIGAFFLAAVGGTAFLFNLSVASRLDNHVNVVAAEVERRLSETMALQRAQISENLNRLDSNLSSINEAVGGLETNFESFSETTANNFFALDASLTALSNSITNSDQQEPASPHFPPSEVEPIREGEDGLEIFIPSNDLELFADSERGSVIDAIATSGNFSTLVSAAQAAGLTESLTAAGPVTLFAPTDAAFASLPPRVIEELLLPENSEQLMALIRNHIVMGEVVISEFPDGAEFSIQTGWGMDVRITTGNSDTFGGASIVSSGFETSNGIVYAIDSLILPPG